MRDSEKSVIFPLGKQVEEKFIGIAYVHILTTPDKTSDILSGNVTFELGARNNWHGASKEEELFIYL